MRACIPFRAPEAMWESMEDTEAVSQGPRAPSSSFRYSGTYRTATRTLPTTRFPMDTDPDTTESVPPAPQPSPMMLMPM